ncbi:MAG TPA: hypothetical protein VF297_01355 [Pyrinomonadaceae bacterium]
MFVGSRRLTFSLVLIASLLLSPVASAQTASSDWSSLKAVASGSKLSVKLKTGKSVEGKLTAVSDDSLSLTVGGKQTELKAGDVSRVYTVGGSSAKKGTLVGLAVGAGGGAAVGAAGGGGDFFPGRGVFAAGGAVLGGGVGALIGYAVGRSRRKRVLVYEAR